MSWHASTHCVVCLQRTTGNNFLPYCSEVCCDSDHALLRRCADHEDFWD